MAALARFLWTEYAATEAGHQQYLAGIAGDERGRDSLFRPVQTIDQRHQPVVDDDHDRHHVLQGDQRVDNFVQTRLPQPCISHDPVRLSHTKPV